MEKVCNTWFLKPWKQKVFLKKFVQYSISKSTYFLFQMVCLNRTVIKYTCLETVLSISVVNQCISIDKMPCMFKITSKSYILQCFMLSFKNWCSRSIFTICCNTIYCFVPSIFTNYSFFLMPGDSWPQEDYTGSRVKSSWFFTVKLIINLIPIVRANYHVQPSRTLATNHCITACFTES